MQATFSKVEQLSYPAAPSISSFSLLRILVVTMECLVSLMISLELDHKIWGVLMLIVGNCYA